MPLDIVWSNPRSDRNQAPSPHDEYRNVFELNTVGRVYSEGHVTCGDKELNNLGQTQL